MFDLCTYSASAAAPSHHASISDRSVSLTTDADVLCVVRVVRARNYTYRSYWEMQPDGQAPEDMHIVNVCTNYTACDGFLFECTYVVIELGR